MFGLNQCCSQPECMGPSWVKFWEVFCWNYRLSAGQYSTVVTTCMPVKTQTRSVPMQSKENPCVKLTETIKYPLCFRNTSCKTSWKWKPSCCNVKLTLKFNRSGLRLAVGISRFINIFTFENWLIFVTGCSSTTVANATVGSQRFSVQTSDKETERLVAQAAEIKQNDSVWWAHRKIPSCETADPHFYKWTIFGLMMLFFLLRLNI